MKQLLTVAICLLFCSSTFSQVSVGVSYTNKGANLQLGALTPAGVDIEAGYKFPFISADVPSHLYLTVGYDFTFAKAADGDGGLFVTPHIGFGTYTVDDFTEYDAKTGPIVKINEVKTMYRLEAGWQKGWGRVFLEGSYCGKPFFGIGFRAFFGDIGGSKYGY